MSKAKRTSDPAELETLRRRIWVYRQRGMTLKQIGEAPNINLSPSTVHHHLKKARNYEFERFDQSGHAEVIGEVLLNLRELYQEALRNMSSAEQGTLLRCTMLDLAGRRLDRMTKFMQEAAIIPKAADRVDVSVRDMRAMSTEEIELEVRQLKIELAHSPKEFIDVNATVTDAASVPRLPMQEDESLEVIRED